ncbi:MAG: metal-dependent hydrolase [Patescibacteria group bacterium]|nr:metal-dependent hydrolase [Patescibacteria group bacterium]
MTGRTHDLAALTALNLVIITTPLPDFSFSTAIFSIGACTIGGLAPDLDQPTSSLWHKIPAGSLIGKIAHPFLGHHRTLSHSILGIIFFGLLSRYLLNLLGQTILVDMSLAWWAFMIGFVSHLIMDTFTTEGVPWFFPIPFHLGIPPLAALRIKTGGWIEKLLVFPGLLAVNFYLIYSFYPIYLQLVKNLWK